MKLALIGGKLSHSYSKIIHELFFDYTGIKGTYKLIEVADSGSLDSQMNIFEQEGYSGINVTIPYKQNILPYVNIASTEVEKLGAANTVHFKDGVRYAYNTDYFGFKRTLELSGVNPEGKSWLILGYGGGAKSVKAVLDDMGATDIFISMTSKTCKDFIDFDKLDELKNIFGVVNTTPVGMYPNTDNSPLDIEKISRFNTAIDIVYNPIETKFLSLAKQAGLICVPGLYMLVAQAVKAQEIWTGREFDDLIINKIYGELEKMI